MSSQCHLSPAILPIWIVGVLAVLLVGCTHTRILNASAADARAEINERAERGVAEITLNTGERVTANRSLHVAPDVVTWIDPASGEARSVSLSELVSVQFSSSGWGAFEGLVYGFLVGSVVGAAVLVAVPDECNFACFSTADKALVGVVLIGVPSAVVGGLVGLGRGHRTVYEILPRGDEALSP